MFKTSKRRIVIFILLFLALFLLLSVSVIYSVSYDNVYRENQTVLTNRADNYLAAMTEEQKEDNASGEADDGFMELLAQHGLSLTLFYAVTLEKDGAVRNVMNVPDSAYTEEELIDVAENMIAANRRQGVYRGWVYQCRETEKYDIAVWMDNTVLSRDVRTLLRNTLIIGSLFIVLMVPVAIKAANGIIAPMEEAEKRQREFLSDAEHELKTPITTIGANAELLSREIGENRWLAAIRQENDRMAKMARELLELSRAESTTPQRSEVSFSKLVLGGILPYEMIAYDRGFLLETEIEPDLTLIGDENQLTRLVSILMDNAVSHSSGTGAIRVVMKGEREHICLAVSNPGEKISADVLAHLFDRFYRADTARSQDGHFGLGLSIAKAITESHGGRISAESDEEQTTFIITFPK